MDIQFSLWPLGDMDLKDEMAEVQEVLDKSGLKYKMNTMSRHSLATGTKS